MEGQVKMRIGNGWQSSSSSRQAGKEDREAGNREQNRERKSGRTRGRERKTISEIQSPADGTALCLPPGCLCQ